MNKVTVTLVTDGMSYTFNSAEEAVLFHNARKQIIEPENAPALTKGKTKGGSFGIPDFKLVKFAKDNHIDPIRVKLALFSGTEKRNGKDVTRDNIRNPKEVVAAFVKSHDIKTRTQFRALKVCDEAKKEILDILAS